MEGDLVAAIRGHLTEVSVPGLAGIDAKRLPRLAGEHVPGALDVRDREWPSVVPFDAFAQWQRQLGSVLVLGPASGQIGHDRLHAVLLHVRVENDEIVEDPHHRRWAITADSSWIDMLAGLSKTGILRTPPCFWANAGAAARIAPSKPPAAASA